MKSNFRVGDVVVFSAPSFCDIGVVVSLMGGSVHEGSTVEVMYYNAGVNSWDPKERTMKANLEVIGNVEEWDREFFGDI